MKKALEAAAAVQKDENVSQASVKAATDGLNEAMEALVKKANKTELDKTIKAAEALNKDDYTADSWKVFAQELADAYTVSRNADATQAEVDAAVKALQDAKKALVEKSNNGNGGNNNNDGNTGNSGNAGSGSQNGNGKKPQNTANKGAQTGDQQAVTMYLVLIAASVIAVSFTKKRKVN